MHLGRDESFLFKCLQHDQRRTDLSLVIDVHVGLATQPVHASLLALPRQQVRRQHVHCPQWHMRHAVPVCLQRVRLMQPRPELRVAELCGSVRTSQMPLDRSRGMRPGPYLQLEQHDRHMHTSAMHMDRSDHVPERPDLRMVPQEPVLHRSRLRLQRRTDDLRTPGPLHVQLAEPLVRKELLCHWHTGRMLGVRSALQLGVQ